ncbi:MAG: hypothetical protein KAT14_02605, partial [Candidatus Marinimicrobia bacterium]|nr:hypothetical protein [Candidatus Neomarinimicrobiota bacterium]
MMRFKILFVILIPLLGLTLFAQETQSRSEFFKEFYGTYINSTDIDIDKEEKTIKTIDLSEVIKQLENLYDVDIPASEEVKFKTAEDVAEYINLYLQTHADEKIEPIKIPEKPKKSHSWKFKLYGSYGLVEPNGVTGDLGWDGNLFGGQAFNLFGDMYTWEAGFAVHPYGWNGKQNKSAKSWGFSYDYSSFNHWGADTTWAAYPNDTTATRWGINMNFQQDLTGRKKARPKVGFYLMESIRLGIHSYGHNDPDLWGNNHLSYGLGFAQGIYF